MMSVLEKNIQRKKERQDPLESCLLEGKLLASRLSFIQVSFFGKHLIYHVVFSYKE
jgi:hypothetical protein